MNKFFKHFGLGFLYLFILFLSQAIAGIGLSFFYGIKLSILEDLNQKQQGVSTLINAKELTTKILEEVEKNLMFAVVISGLLTIFAMFIIFKLMKRNLMNEVGIAKIKPINVLFAIVLGFASGIFTLILLTFASLFEVLNKIFETYNELTNSIQGDNLITGIIIVGMIVPFIEEFFFRGLILGEFKKVMPIPVAVILQAIIFGVFHFNIIQSTYAALIGIVLGLLFIWTKSLWAPIIAHMTINCQSFLLDKVNLSFLDNPITMVLVAYISLLVILVGLLILKNSQRVEFRKNTLL